MLNAETTRLVNLAPAFASAMRTALKHGDLHSQTEVLCGLVVVGKIGNGECVGIQATYGGAGNRCEQILGHQLNNSHHDIEIY